MTKLQNIINDIKNGTESEQIEFAKLLVKASGFLNKQNADEIEAQRTVDINIANDWWNTNIKPTITWNNSQPLDEQRENILNDYKNTKSLLQTETDIFRKIIIKQKLEQANTKFKEIKKAISEAS